MAMWSYFSTTKMKRPLGLPDRFISLFDESKNGEELFTKLIEKGDQEIIEVLEFTADDHTWVDERGGRPFMDNLLPWVTEKFRHNSIPRPMAERISKSIRKNYSCLGKSLPKDVSLMVDKQIVPVHSLLFRTLGDVYFRDLFEDKSPTIELPNINKDHLNKIAEFIYTGGIEGLWKEEPKEISSLIDQANALDFKELGTYTFSIYKHYIEKEMILKRLLLALKDKEAILVEEMCEMINQEHLGFILNFESFGRFSAEIVQVWEDDEPYLLPLAPHITHITCHDLEKNSPLLFRLFPRCRRLEGVDFSGSPQGQFEELLSTLSILHELNLEGCEWVNDRFVKKIAESLTNVRKINLGGIRSVTYSGYSELATLKGLDTLNLTGHRGLGDDELALLIDGLPNIGELILSGCEKLTDEALDYIADHAKYLEHLRVDGCPKLTEYGLKRVKDLTAA